jgi:hypothetical protein
MSQQLQISNRSRQPGESKSANKYKCTMPSVDKAKHKMKTKIIYIT